MNFSERNGFISPNKLIQLDSINEELKNRIWNIFNDYFNSLYSSERIELSKLIKRDFLNKKIIEPFNYDSTYELYNLIHRWFIATEWYRIYDFIEFIASTLDSNSFVEQCNNALKQEFSGYRIINKIVVPITSEIEIKEIENAFENAKPMSSVSTHLNSALGFISDKINPDYRNSVKEAISAVESYCKLIANNDKATLGEAIEIVEKKHKIHGALKSAFKSIYGYTSDSGGIRHSLLEDDIEVKFEDAMFMLVCCSVFINYLKIKIYGK